MADKRRVHSAIAIELFFERKNHQRFVDILAKQLHASLPPRPELRADVVNHWDAALAHLPRHAPIEGRSVDHDGQRRPFLIGRADQLSIEPKNLRQMAKNLSDADDRKVLSIDNNFASGSSHALSARAEEFKLPGLCGGGALPRLDGAELRRHMRRDGYAAPQRFDQLRSEEHTSELQLLRHLVC